MCKQNVCVVYFFHYRSIEHEFVGYVHLYISNEDDEQHAVSYILSSQAVLYFVLA